MDTRNEYDVSIAFSKQSQIFDQIYNGNSITLWMRYRVRKETLKYLKKGDRLLEVNCGTGIDSIFFATQGCQVVATDNADGMLQELDQKILSGKLSNSIVTKKCSFNDIGSLGMGSFDYVFSNFGGLNCTDKLYEVIEAIDKVLNIGGYFSLVIMPPVCPWELLMLLKADIKTAFRRFKKNGTNAHIEGHRFLCYYYQPGYVIKHAGPNYQLKSLKGLSIAVPPPFIEFFIEKHPRIFRILESFENKVWDKYPFNQWCDHYIITMQKIA